MTEPIDLDAIRQRWETPIYTEGFTGTEALSLCDEVERLRELTAKLTDLLLEATPEYMGGTPDTWGPECGHDRVRFDGTPDASDGHDNWQCWSDQVWEVVPRG